MVPTVSEVLESGPARVRNVREGSQTGMFS